MVSVIHQCSKSMQTENLVLCLQAMLQKYFIIKKRYILYRDKTPSHKPENDGQQEKKSSLIKVLTHKPKRHLNHSGLIIKNLLVRGIKPQTSIIMTT